MNFSRSIPKNRAYILIISLVLDVVAVFSAAFVAYRLRFVNEDQAYLDVANKFSVSSFSILLIICFGWISTLALSGLYTQSNLNLAMANLRIVFRQSLFFFFGLGFLSFLIKASFSRIIFLAMFLIGVLLLAFNRLMSNLIITKILHRRKYLLTSLVLVGTNPQVIERYANWLIENRYLGYKIVGRIVMPKIDLLSIRNFDEQIRLTDQIELLLLPGIENDENFIKFIHYVEDLGIHINWIPLNSGNLGYWKIPSIQEGSPFLTFRSSDISLVRKIQKRVFDIIATILILIAIAPLLASISLAVLVSDGRPIIYTQKRIGRNGKPFTFYKFRTMVNNADELLQNVPSTKGHEHILFKSHDDPRITRLGRFLRRYSLDELPQFFNVLGNSMSIVGPRPALPKEVIVYDSLYERRLIAKPGITGPWQISGRSDLDLQTSVALDLNYLTHWSFTRDILIIFSTIGAIFKGRGAY
jgi:exopolysaccharide biosynthesis polyprenyl glycosylphosphotransferase